MLRRRRNHPYPSSSHKQTDYSSSSSSSSSDDEAEDYDTTGKSKYVDLIVSKQNTSFFMHKKMYPFLICVATFCIYYLFEELTYSHMHWSRVSYYFQQISHTVKGRQLDTTATTISASNNKWTQVAKTYSEQSPSSSTAVGHDYLWSQNVGLHYMEYFEKKGVCHALPPGRSDHTVVGYGVNSSGFLHSATKRSLLSSRNSYLVTFGGRIGQGAKRTYSRGRSLLLNDTWLFVSGVANTTNLAEIVKRPAVSQNTVRQVLDPSTGQSCFEDSEEPTTSTSCSVCNRWHRVKADARSRWTSECQRGVAKDTMGYTKPEWCTYPLATTLSTSPISLNRSGHTASTISRNAQPEEGNSLMIMFGGETLGTTGTGETFDNDVWYLSGLSTPNSVGDTTSSSVTEWRCLETYSHYDPFPGTAPTPSSSYCTTDGGEEIVLGAATDGIIGTGTLKPVQKCKWILKTETAHAIVLDVTTLDLDHATLCRAGMLEIYDGVPSSDGGATTNDGESSGAILLGRGCSLEAGESSWDNLRFTAFSGTMTIKIRYESPCSNHDGFSATYKTIASDAISNATYASPLDCPTTCPDLLPCLDVCSGKGTCIHGSCACQDGRHGLNCEFICTRNGPCDKLEERKSGVARSGLGFPQPRRGHSVASVQMAAETTVLQQWSDSSSVSTTPIVAAPTTAPCPTVSSTFTTTQYEPLELQNAGVVTELSSTKTTFSFAGISSRKITRVTTKATVSGHRRLLFFGGELRRGAGMSNELWTLDFQQPASSADSDCHISTSDTLNVDLVGGACVISTTRCNTYPDTAKYGHFPRPPLHHQWTKWSSLNANISPPARAGHTSVIMPSSNIMIVFGGRSSSGAVLDDLWGLNVSTVSNDIQGNVGSTSASLRNNKAQWIDYSDAIGYKAKVSSATFDGEFAATVSYDGSFTVGQDDRVTLSLLDDTIVLDNVHVFSADSTASRLQNDITRRAGIADSTSNTFRFISKRSDLTGTTYTGTAEIFPRARTDHAASVMQLDEGETMMIYGGVGAGPKLLRDVWKMSFDIDTGKAKWKQVQKSRGNYLHVGK